MARGKEERSAMAGWEKAGSGSSEAYKHRQARSHTAGRNRQQVCIQAGWQWKGTEQANATHPSTPSTPPLSLIPLHPHPSHQTCPNPVLPVKCTCRSMVQGSRERKGGMGNGKKKRRKGTRRQQRKHKYA